MKIHQLNFLHSSINEYNLKILKINQSFSKKINLIKNKKIITQKFLTLWVDIFGKIYIKLILNTYKY